MTRTVQPLTWTTVKKVEKPRRTGAEESIAYGSIASRNIVDGNIRELLSICDSLNKLCDTLNRLENVLKSKNIQHL